MFGKLKISFTVAVLFIIIWTNAACLQKDTKTDNSTKVLQPTLTPEIIAAEKDNLSNANLTCSPDKLKAGDILTLKMKSPHGGYLEIVTPDNQYIFLSELDGDKLVEDAQKAGATPFFPASEFAKLGELKINTSDATTVNYDKDKENGKPALSKIFSVKGNYKILLSEDSFETDDPVITGECRVYFDGKETSVKTFNTSGNSTQSDVKVKFAKGQSQAVFEGSLRGADTRDYIVNARQEQELNVSIEAKTNYKNLFTIFEANTNNALAIEEDSYTGKLNENGSYIIRVFTYSKSDNLTEKDVSKYLLKISVR